jgi:predicted nuclease of predicted toxin-antitoxin system
MPASAAPKLLVDENFPIPSVRVLRRHGIDVLAVIETCPRASDTAILALACEQGRWIATYDRDYGELVFKYRLQPPPAILYFRQEPFPASRAADLILQLLEQAEEIIGHLVVVGEASLRLHKLPD